MIGFVKQTCPTGPSMESEGCMQGEAAGRKTNQEAIAVILMGDDVARSKAGEDEVGEEGGFTRYGD